MILPTSVRDVSKLEKKVNNLPEEVKHNTAVLRNILGYADRIYPEFANIPETRVKQLAEMVAYTLRTDLILRANGYLILGPKILLHGRIPEDSPNEGVLGVLANDPNRLYPGWGLMSDEEHNLPNFWTVYSRASEFARCYQFILNKFFPKEREMLCQSPQGGVPEYDLADLTAYLLDVNDLDDYRYTPEEVRSFHERLLESWREEFPEEGVEI
jgi:hypothetical protein